MHHLKSTQRMKKRRFASSILISFLSLTLVNCASWSIPNPEICAEIPFIDGPEGACADTQNKSRIIPAGDWAQKRPFMIMISAEQWVEIKKSWKKACHTLGPQCDTVLESADKAIIALQKMQEQMMRIP